MHQTTCTVGRSTGWLKPFGLTPCLPKLCVLRFQRFLCFLPYRVWLFCCSLTSPVEGWQPQKKGSMAGQARMEELLAKAVTVDGRKEWYCRFCSETDVWTTSECLRCQTNIPSLLQGRHKQAVSNIGMCVSIVFCPNETTSS